MTPVACEILYIHQRSGTERDTRPLAGTFLKPPAQVVVAEFGEDYMKSLLKSKRVLWAAALLFMITDLAMASDLIDPTRTLYGAVNATGSLTVLSEPPGLEVALNGTHLGKTPLFLDRVKPGIHTLWVKDSETTIDIKPDAILRISLFKGRFINIPAAKTEAVKTPTIRQEKVNKSRSPQPPSREAGENDLTPWERFVNGSSKYF
jgi:hypothetical protein